MFIKVFSLTILLILTAAIVGGIIALAMWPGRTARARNHPYADAVGIAGWVGIIAGGVLWPFALVWAYATPEVVTTSSINSVRTTVPESDNGESAS